ncbi:hypothetical protein HNQ59_003413 [Chitinivorax tropicus]|uniref:Uncharacterized protein n=1 Tax=Chitinivorax tropicus TaxID=714531 RepID=A0A840MSN6_9PROT|nr:hypothetical protein [Chitinivorax tropicus]MBB5020099.1 hypothetical protein [Chitinivorax tropicus]
MHQTISGFAYQERLLLHYRIPADVEPSQRELAGETADGEPMVCHFSHLDLKHRLVPTRMLKQDISFVWAGMTFIAEIKNDSRRVIDYLLSPIKEVFSEAIRER